MRLQAVLHMRLQAMLHAVAGRAACGCRLCHPRLQVLNSLLYWLIDLAYRAMGVGLHTPRWAPEPYLLRLPGVEARMVAALCELGHLLDVLARAPAADDAEGMLDGMLEGMLEGPELLRALRQTETTATLLSAIRSACEERSEVEAGAPPPRVVARYSQLVASPGLGLTELQTLQHEALAELLDLEVGFVAARHAAIAAAFGEWRRPELLFRYLDDNRGDAKAAALISRWLRSIFGLSAESVRQIRREAHANVAHLATLPQGVMLRWYAEACPGTSSMQVRLTPSHTHPTQRSCSTTPHISHIYICISHTTDTPWWPSRRAMARAVIQCHPAVPLRNPGALLAGRGRRLLPAHCQQ